MPALALLLLSLTPHDAVVRDRCARLETNHVYSDCGNLNFTQLIGFEPTGRVFFWRMQKGQIDLRRDWERGGYVARWSDDGTLREVWALSHDETWEMGDKELADRELLPVNERRQLKQNRTSVLAPVPTPSAASAGDLRH